MMMDTINTIMRSAALLLFIIGATVVTGSEVQCKEPATEGYSHTIIWDVRTIANSFTIEAYNVQTKSMDIIVTCYTRTLMSRPSCMKATNDNYYAMLEESKGRHTVFLTISKVDRTRDGTAWILNSVLASRKRQIQNCRLQVFSSCPKPAKEGLPYTFTQVVPSLNDKFVWEFYQTVGTIKTLTSCYPLTHDAPFCYTPPNNTWYTASIVDLRDGRYNLSLTINEATRTRDENIWIWSRDGLADQSWGCYLGIYTFDSPVECDDSPHLISTGTQHSPSLMVFWQCQIMNVYPQPTCRFEYSSQDYVVGVGSSAISESSSRASDGFNNAMVYRHKCNMTFTVSNLKPGTHTFKVTAFPDVMWKTPYMQKEVTSDFTLSVSGLDCDQPSLTQDHKAIKISCRATSPYQQVVCRLQQSKNNNKWEYIKDSQVVPDQPSCIGQPPFCSYGCSVTKDIASLGDGSYRFRMVAFVLENGVTKFIVATSNPSAPFTLGLPIAATSNCPSVAALSQGYIKAGSSATCQCYLSYEGFPPGYPQWLDSQNNTVGQLHKGISTVYLNHISGEPDPTYTCVGISTLGRGPPNSYTPKFAYGPSNVLITVNGNNPTLNLCMGIPKEFTVYCYVQKSSVNPKPKVHVTGRGIETPELVDDGISLNSGVEYYRYKYTIRPGIEGPLTVTCVARNPVFGELNAEKPYTLTVQVPPPKRPKISLDDSIGLANGTTETIILGHNHKVSCSVEGGYPPKHHIQLVCSRPQWSSLGGSDGTLRFQVTKTMNGATCKCSAQHDTRCYDKTSVVFLDVHYKPEIKHFTVNAVGINIVVDAGTNVVFSLEAEGNPKPKLYIRGQSSMKQLTLLDSQQTGSYYSKSGIRQVMSCVDTDGYICAATNDLGTAQERTISVFVRCTPEIASSDNDTKDFNVTPGSPLIIEVPIVGYPEPKESILTKVSNSSIGEGIGGGGDRVKRSTPMLNTAGSVGSLNYNVTYIAHGKGKGKVVVRMTGLEKGDSGQYVLTIKNGIGDGLEHGFTVVVRTDYQPGPGNPDEDDSDGGGGGGGGSYVLIFIGIGIGLSVIIVVVIVAFIFKKKGRQYNKENDKRMNHHNHKTAKEGSYQDLVQINNDIYGKDEDEAIETKHVMHGPNRDDYVNPDVQMKDNEVYGMDQNEDGASTNDPYTELNEDEIVSIRKESATHPQQHYVNTGPDKSPNRNRPKQVTPQASTDKEAGSTGHDYDYI